MSGADEYHRRRGRVGVESAPGGGDTAFVCIAANDLDTESQHQRFLQHQAARESGHG